MVYRGKPSTGCQKCRQRKIKCDERIGGCLKCAEKNFPCPGYNHSVDRLFRDETAAVKVKADKSKAKAIIARDKRHKATQEKGLLRKGTSAIGMPLLAPMTDYAIAYFMHKYAWGLDEPPMHSKFFNQHLNTYGFHPIIATSMTALGLAGVADTSMDPNLKRLSTKWYATALKMTNKALSDPVEVKSDNTLLATIILSVFESITNERTFAAWSYHVQGSSSLLRMRGNDQFSTPAGRRMWLQTIGLLTLQCLAMGEELPDYVHEMNEKIRHWDNKDDPGLRFYHLHIDAIDFRAQILKGRFTDLQIILDRAFEIEEAVNNIFAGVDEKWWGYDIVNCSPGTPGVFGTCYHLYPTLQSAQTWNWIRHNRIYLHDIIRNALIAGLSTSPPIFSGPRYLHMLETSTQILYQMQADIMAAIPQFLQDVPARPTTDTDSPERDIHISRSVSPVSLNTGPDPFSLRVPIPEHSYTPSTSPAPDNILASLPSPPSSTISAPSPYTQDRSSSPYPSPALKLMGSNFPSDSTPLFTRDTHNISPMDRLPIIRIAGGFSSLWALYIAGAMPIASPESQEYVITSLLKTGVEFGVKQAYILASALRVKMNMDRKEREGGMVMDEEETVEGTERKRKWSRIAPIYMPMVGPHVDD